MLTHEQAKTLFKNDSLAKLTKAEFKKLPGGLDLLAVNSGAYVPDDMTRSEQYEQYGSRILTFSKFDWSDKKYARGFEKLLGVHVTPLLADAYQLSLTLPIDINFARSPYRSSKSSDYDQSFTKHLENWAGAARSGRLNRPLNDLMLLGVHCGYDPIELLLAAQMNREGKGSPTRQLLTDTVLGEEDAVKVSYCVIRALLISDDPEGWEAVGKLLLAAQRQEGLRQIILEAIDSTHTGAFRYFIDLILEHKLVRFASVVRAVDTWFGFGWDVTKAATVTRVLEFARTALTSKLHATEMLTSDNSLEVFIGLWAIGVSDVDEAATKAVELLNRDVKQHQFAALYFFSQIGERRVLAWPFTQACFGEDRETDAYITLAWPFPEKIDSDFAQRLELVAQSLPKDGQRFEGTVFSWLTPHLIPDRLYHLLLHHGDEGALKRLVAKFESLPLSIRDRVMSALLPNAQAHSFAYIKNLKRIISILLSN
ncbi:MAG: hypothetical protein AB8F78_09215 [Saprospiraceae bacterium]